MTGPVVALAGRRIDAPGAPARFPARAEPTVARGIEDLLDRVRPAAFVSSAACGADLIGLEVAGRLGIPRRVILPFEREKFRRTSVIDRPGDWGSRFDTVLDGIEDSEIVDLGLEGDDVYAIASDAILDQANRLAGPAGVLAVVVWNGESRGPDDITARFAADAAARGFDVHEINTNVTPTEPGPQSL